MLAEFSPQMHQHYQRLTGKNTGRDNRHSLIQAVRAGYMRQLFPDDIAFNTAFTGVPIANFIDIVARDMAEVIAPLPSLACTSGRMQSDSDRRRAMNKNRIGDNFWVGSRLEQQMLTGADHYVTYGFLPFYVEPDLKSRQPYIHVESPINAYYELDRYGQPTIYAKYWLKTVDELCAMFPDLERIICDDGQGGTCQGGTQLKMVRWVDKERVTLFLPERRGLILNSYDHKLSRLPVWIAERPGDGDEPRGQFDDVVWVQVARAMMGTYALEAAALAVQAPIAVPEDMDEFPVGPHAILQSENAKDIHRVPLELPASVFAEGQVLDGELKMGSRYPDARTGGMKASVITGKGVEALLGTFDTQIKGAQMVLRVALEQVTSRCFETDEVWFANESKVIRGNLSGQSYELTYTPARDINGRWDCTVTYGFAAGMHPAQSIVTMLQLVGAGVIAKETFQENLPFQIDALQEKRKIDTEGAREALKQGLFSVIQSAGPMALQGQDPTPFLRLATDAIRATQEGKSIEDAIAGAFEAMEQAKQEEAERAAAAQADAQAAAPGGGAGGGEGGDNPLAFNGLPQGVAPGQAGLPPGGSPTIMQAVAGFRGNANLPINSAVIRRNIPTGN